MDAIESLIGLYLTRGGGVFISPQYDFPYSQVERDGGACPDFVALDMRQKEVVIVEVTTAANLTALYQRVQSRHTRWFVPIQRRLSNDGVIGSDWPIRFLGFVRDELAPKANATFVSSDDVNFVGVERAAFSFAYWKEREVGLPTRSKGV